jgi:hypothetical protein
VASYRKDDLCAKAATLRHAPSPEGPVFATLSSGANRDHPPTSAISNAAGRGGGHGTAELDAVIHNCLLVSAKPRKRIMRVLLAL